MCVQLENRDLVDILDHLVAVRVAFIPFHASWDAHSQTPQPQTDSAAQTKAALHVPLTGLQKKQTHRRIGIILVFQKEQSYFVSIYARVLKGHF